MVLAVSRELCVFHVDGMWTSGHQEVGVSSSCGRMWTGGQNSRFSCGRHKWMTPLPPPTHFRDPSMAAQVCRHLVVKSFSSASSSSLQKIDTYCNTRAVETIYGRDPF